MEYLEGESIGRRVVQKPEFETVRRALPRQMAEELPPTSGELAEAVREFLESEILPGIQDPRTKFHTLVAINALGILGRELAQEESLLRSEHERLSPLLGQLTEASGTFEGLKEQVLDMNRDLADLIRAGEPPPGTFGNLKQTVAEKLAVASPRYLERYVDKP